MKKQTSIKSSIEIANTAERVIRFVKYPAKMEALTQKDLDLIKGLRKIQRLCQEGITKIQNGLPSERYIITDVIMEEIPDELMLLEAVIFRDRPEIKCYAPIHHGDMTTYTTDRLPEDDDVMAISFLDNHHRS